MFEGMIVNTTILCQSVCISDLVKQVWQKCQIIHKPTFLCSSLVKSCVTDTIQRVTNIYIYKTKKLLK